MSENIRPLKIGGLTARIPIVQGGMGVGVSLSHLAGAVAAEGGIGMISAAQIGFYREEFKTDPFKANLLALEEQIRKGKEIAKGGIVGVNIMSVMNHYKEYVKACVKAGADLIVSGAGLPMSLPEYVKGSDVKIAPIVSSGKAMNVICKLWDRSHHVTPDLVVVEGPLAGGHLGFSEKQLEPFRERDEQQEKQALADFDVEVKKVMELAKKFGEKYEKEIPVVVAGGIDTPEKVKHYLDMGADGIQAATPFVTTVECDAHPAFKEAYVNATRDDVVILKSPVGMPGRGIRNKFLEKVNGGEKRPIFCKQCMEHCDPKTIPYCITDALIRSVEGDVDNGLIFCGANVDQITKISTVREVMCQLMPEIEELR